MTTNRWWRRRAPAVVATSPVVAPGSTERLLRRLDLAVVRRLDGLRQGEHPTVAFGPGLDLGDLRPYAPGDDVRSLDWNVTARTGVPHVRRFHEDRDIGAWLVLDLSGSMDFGTGVETKSERVMAVTGTLVRLLQARGDRVGALLYGGSVPTTIEARQRMRPDRPASRRRRVPVGLDGPARANFRPAERVGASSGRTHALRLLQRAMAIARGLLRTPGQRNTPATTHPTTDLANLLEQAVGTIRARSLVVIISDFLDSTGGSSYADLERWTRTLRALAGRHDVIGIALQDIRESVLPDAGVVTFEDLESGLQVTVDTSQVGIREAFGADARARRQGIARAFAHAGGLYWPLDTAEPVVTSIVRLLETRRRMSTGLRRTQSALTQ